MLRSSNVIVVVHRSALVRAERYKPFFTLVFISLLQANGSATHLWFVLLEEVLIVLAEIMTVILKKKLLKLRVMSCKRCLSCACDATASSTVLHSGSTCNNGNINGATLAESCSWICSENPIAALLPGCMFGAGCAWVKLVWNQGLPHTKPQWRPVRREKEGKKSPWPHQCLISKPVFNNSIAIFPSLYKGWCVPLSWAAVHFSQGFPKHRDTGRSEPCKGIAGNLKEKVGKRNPAGVRGQIVACRINTSILKKNAHIFHVLYSKYCCLAHEEGTFTN